MASSKRERELARMRAERQAARRAAAEARRKQQRKNIAAVVGGLVVAAVVVGAVLITSGSNDDKLNTAANPSSSPLVSTAPSSGATGSCTYTKSGTSSKKISGLPPTTKVVTNKLEKFTLATNQGEIDLTLNTAKAPCTVNSFTFLVGQKYFDNTSCHRLTTSGIYVLQCGDPAGTGSGGPGYKFADEALTGAVYPKGTIAMANAGAGTNGSQFFLVYKDTQLPPSYTPFGLISKGLDVIAKVAAGGSNPTGDGKPKIPVTIQKATAL